MDEEFDYAEYDRLQNEKSVNEAQQSQCQSEINSLDDEISMLGEAYETIKDAKGYVKDIQKEISKIPDKELDGWKGSVFESLRESSEESGLKEIYESYIDNINTVEDAINWDINHKEEERNEKYGILSGLKNTWDDLCTWIGNLFN